MFATTWMWTGQFFCFLEGRKYRVALRRGSSDLCCANSPSNCSIPECSLAAVINTVYFPGPWILPLQSVVISQESAARMSTMDGMGLALEGPATRRSPQAQGSLQWGVLLACSIATLGTHLSPSLAEPWGLCSESGPNCTKPQAIGQRCSQGLVGSSTDLPSPLQPNFTPDRFIPCGSHAH